MEIDTNTFAVILVALSISLGLNLYHAMKDLGPFFSDGSGGRRNKLFPRNDMS